MPALDSRCVSFVRDGLGIFAGTGTWSQAMSDTKERKLRKDYFDLADLLLMAAPCQHENSGVCCREGVKVCQCNNCGKVLWRSAGGPDPDDPAYGC